MRFCHERARRSVCIIEAHVSLCWPADTQIQPVMSCLVLSHFCIAQVLFNFPLFTANKCRGWNAYDCASVQMFGFFSTRAYHVSFAQLLSESFPQHLLHPIFGAVLYGNSYAGSPFSCLLRNSQALVKATRNPSIRYLSDCIMDIMDHICIPYH